MFLVDITYPQGALDGAARTALASKLSTAILGGDGDGVPEATMRRARAMTHVVFHPAESWTTGHGPLRDDSPAPYLVTVTVPDAWRKDVSEHTIGAIRTALLDDDPVGAPTRAGGDVWINVVGVRDGSIGLDGRPSTADDVVLFMTEEHRANPDVVELPDGVVADPICGMHVTLGPDAITLVHDGETLGFCSRGCRSSYARSHGLAASGG